MLQNTLGHYIALFFLNYYLERQQHAWPQMEALTSEEAQAAETN